MRGPRPLSSLILLSALFPVCQTARAAPLFTFEERVRAQEAIDRVSYSHQIDARRSFEEAIPPDLLESKVRAYLAQSAALETYWNTPITAEMPQLELTRMAARTQLPGRPQELFEALGNDPFLIQECLVRPRLADRLARHRFASDPRIHEVALQEARALRRNLSRGSLEPTAPHANRYLEELVRRQDGESRTKKPRPGVLELGCTDFDYRRGLAPQNSGTIGRVTGEHEAYTIRVVLEEDPDRAQIATCVLPKRTWDDWWSVVLGAIDTTDVHAVANGNIQLPATESRGAPCSGDGWTPGALEDMPDRRSSHTAVWTGTEMIIWGGYGVTN